MSVQYSMPIIGPTLNYDQIVDRVVVSSASDRGLEIRIIGASADESKIYTTLGGAVLFQPDSPGGTNGKVVIYTWIMDAKGLMDWSPDAKSVPKDVPRPGMVIYESIDAATVRPKFEALLNASNDTLAMKKLWTKNNPNASQTPTLVQMRAHVVDLMMAGAASFLCPGETHIAEATPYTSGTETGVKFIYRWYDADLQVYQNPMPATNALSPIPFIQAMPGFDVRWENHPLAIKTKNIAVPVDMHLQFEVYEPLSNMYKPLNNVVVQLWDSNQFFDEQIQTGTTYTTDATGRVTISLADVRGLGTGVLDEYADLYLKLLLNGRSVPVTASQTITLPNEWDTFKGGDESWRATDGSPGYYPDYRGTRLGTQNKPLTFRVGVDYHFKIDYVNQSVKSAPKKDFPVPGCIFEVYKENSVPDELVHATKVGLNGEVHGLILDVEPQDVLYFVLRFQLDDDPSIGMKSVTVSKSAWDFDPPVDGQRIDGKTVRNAPAHNVARQGLPSFGEPAQPIAITAIDYDAAALYVLKCAREFNQFMHTITAASPNRWTGMDMAYGLVGFGTGLAWPLGTIWLGPYAMWNRETIYHESGHQVMWKLLDVGDLETLRSIVHEDGIITHHNRRKITTQVTALIEGWAEFLGIFGNVDVATRRPNVETVSYQQQKNPPYFPLDSQKLLGEKVEGALAASLFQIMELFAVTPAKYNNSKAVKFSDTFVVLNESVNGDLLSVAGNNWILDVSIQSQFAKLFWEPLQLNGGIIPTTSGVANELANNIIDYPANAAIAHKLRGQFNAFNIAVVAPEAAGLTDGSGGLPTGSVSGGTQFKISGSKFALGQQALGSSTVYEGHTVVTFGGIVATTNVVDSTTITGITPRGNAPGLVDVEVYVYIRVPKTTPIAVGIPAPPGAVEKVKVPVQWQYT